jgi:hypothetical protein
MLLLPFAIGPTKYVHSWRSTVDNMLSNVKLIRYPERLSFSRLLEDEGFDDCNGRGG